MLRNACISPFFLCSFGSLKDVILLPLAWRNVIFLSSTASRLNYRSFVCVTSDEGHLETLFNVKLLPISEQDPQRKSHHSLTKIFAVAVSGIDVQYHEHSKIIPHPLKGSLTEGWVSDRCAKQKYNWL